MPLNHKLKSMLKHPADTRLRILFVAWLAMVSGITGFSQVRLQGMIVDSTRQGIGYAGVQLMATDTYSLLADSMGRFSQVMRNPGPVRVRVSYINYALWDSTFFVSNDTAVIIVLKANPENINEVVVVAHEKRDNTVVTLGNSEIALRPKGFGEADIISALQQKAGVAHAAEISPGLYVRGMEQGNAGTYLNGFELFGTNHMLSIFPQFNSDAIDAVKLVKADFEPRYGGYLSSYLLAETSHDVSEGFAGKFETGVLTTKARVEGPLIPGRLSARLAFRYSYFDLIAALYNRVNSGESDVNKLSMYRFHDLNGSLTWHTKKKGTLMLDVLNTADQVEFDDEDLDVGSSWQNQMVSVSWRVPLSSRTNFTLLTGYTGFRLEADFRVPHNRKVKNSISQGSATALFNMSHTARLKTETGIDLKMNRLELETATTTYRPGEYSRINSKTPAENAALFGSIQWFATQNLQLKGGARLEVVFSDTTYIHPMPYVAANYSRRGLTVNLSYSRQIQYRHLYVPTGINLPLNIWYPSQSDVPPAKADHVNLSVSKNIDNKFMVSLTGYYVSLTDLTEFLEGNYFTSLNFVTDKGRGYSRGLETSFAWRSKRFEVEGGFTLARSRRKFQSINNGNWFSPVFDIRHKADLGIVYKPGNRWTFTLSQFIQDGFVMTLPTSIYMHQTADAGGKMEQTIVPVYTSRYNFRMPLSHRMDVSGAYRFKWNRSEATLVLGIYNVYNYQNPYFIYFSPETDADQRVFLQARKKSLIPLVPFVSFNCSF